MRSVLLRTLVLVSLLLIGCRSHADDAAVRKALTADYATISQAFRKNNMAAISGHMTTDFTATRPDGKITGRLGTLAALGRQRSALLVADWQRTIVKLTVTGAEATATVNGRLFGVVTDDQSRHHELRVIATSKDIWVKTGGGWKMRSSRFLTGSTTLDGKPGVLDALGK